MAQFIVRNLEDDVRDILRERAKKNGHSMEEEIRDILRAAAVKQDTSATSLGLGSRIAKRFVNCALDEDIPEWRGGPVQTPSFDA